MIMSGVKPDVVPENRLTAWLSNRLLTREGFNLEDDSLVAIGAHCLVSMIDNAPQQC
jgi:hypothetical protein